LYDNGKSPVRRPVPRTIHYVGPSRLLVFRKSNHSHHENTASENKHVSSVLYPCSV
jgi:hypothetical protein